MHVLLTNDDGPPDAKVSPYVEQFVESIRALTDWDLSIVVPHVQRSWIGKAHIIGKNITGEYMYTGPNAPKGTFESPQKVGDDVQEWITLDGTPASCANIGCNHMFSRKNPVDFVISGPNYGRNTSAPYILSSGTVGGALEAVMCGRKAFAVSFSYTRANHPEDHIKMASDLSVRLIKHLLEDWHSDVQLYSINIPLFDELSENTPVRFVPLLEHSWGAVFSRDEPEKLEFRWNPQFHLCDQSVREHGPGSDAYTVMDKEISVTPFRAAYRPVEHLHGKTINLKDIDLGNSIESPIRAFIETPDKYVESCWLKTGLKSSKFADSQFFYEDYDVCDFEARRPENLYYSYVIRKGLIRKNYLGNLVSYYAAKHPQSILNRAFPESFNLELDYAEFLDDSLDEAYELRQEMENNRTWILKPAMGDRAYGIRVFKTEEALQQIFEELEAEHNPNDEDEGLPFRHYVVQEYMNNPLLVDKRKFHIRTYVLCAGALKVYVYPEMLALFAGTEYKKVDRDLVTDLSGHLTNTCAQSGQTDAEIVKLFSKLPLPEHVKDKVVSDINLIVADLFAAAAADPVNFQPLPNAVEFFGLDFLVNEHAEPILLEVNAYPDFAQTGTDLQHVVQGLFDDTVEAAVKPFFQIPGEPKRLTKVLDMNMR